MSEPGAEPEASPQVRLQNFHELMQRRVLRILLVSSLYDSFIMSEEGHLHETLLGYFMDLNLSQVPDLIQVSTTAEALERAAQDDRLDLVITSLRTSDGTAVELAERLRAAGHELPVIGLAYESRDLADFVAREDTSSLERLFLWQGDVRILLAMVKYMEDRLNVENDTGVCGVPAIIVVEDSVRFYSSFLPTIYAELYKHTHQLLSGDLNLSQKMMHLRARPRVLLSDTYEEAWEFFERYHEHVLGVISDFEFPREGKPRKRAGLDLCARVLERRRDIRLVMQSSDPENRRYAEGLGASFLLKGSPVLLHELRDILVDRFGFGDFIFRVPEGTEIDRAGDLRTFARKLRTLPAECIAYHAERSHFANWLKARTEFELAEKFRPRDLEDFESVEHLRRHLLGEIDRFREKRKRTVIADFEHSRFDPSVTITRVGGGSLGGKARGIAFANRVLQNVGFDESFPDVDVYVPPSVVLGTEVFDDFLGHWGMREIAIGRHTDREIERQFLSAPFPRRAISDLRSFLERVRYPIAVRSSSLLEDSLSQPFAGVYQTIMLPNNDRLLDPRWNHLAAAIKRVYASTFTRKAKEFLSMTSYRLEEEKMAVLIQQIVGRQHHDRFYPDFAGVARSYNFYPEPGHAAEDGVVALALGLGRTVVGGGRALRFCPRYPRQIVSFSSVSDALESSQRDFYGVDLRPEGREPGLGTVRSYGLDVAEEDGPLSWVGSTFSAENNVIVDGISRPGVRLVSFAQVLKHGALPLAEMLCDLLDECTQSTGAPVEIEFAGNLAGPRGERPELGFLQLRPLAVSSEHEQVEIGEVADDALVCRTQRVLGNGRIDDLTDIVTVDLESFDRLKTPEVAVQVAKFDAILRREGRPYLLIGLGRWGSSDPHLGIPVTWNQIAGARVIVESGLKDMRVEPTQGTHFFQNLTSSGTGYFTVNPDAGEGVLDWRWLAAQPEQERTEFVRHLRLERPFVVKMSGHTGDGVIYKPGAS